MANSMSMVNRMSMAVKTLFKKYPMASNAVVYGTLITGAEFTQQTITKKILVSCMLPQWPLWHLHCFFLTCTIAGKNVNDMGNKDIEENIWSNKGEWTVEN